MFVEEMYDYLEDDFAFSDSTGRTLRFERMFIQSDDDSGIVFGGDAEAELNDTITKFLQTHPDTEYFQKLQATTLQKLSN